MLKEQGDWADATISSMALWALQVELASFLN